MVDKYWSALEWDFQSIGLRAMDWVAGKKDWREFYRIKEGFGQGYKYFAAVANDPDVAYEIAASQSQRRREGTEEPYSPPADGWFPWRDDMADLKDQMTAMRGALTGAAPHQLHWAPRPVYLSEKIRSDVGRKRARMMAAQLVPDQDIQTED